jgi:hypothetical protein
LSSQPAALAWIAEIVLALGGLLPETVFVGGAAMQVHLLDSDADVRTTEDVDCVVEITTRADYYAYANELRKRGFQEDTREGAPLCRWRFRGITIDVMPCSEEVLGYSNRWYPPGIQNAISVELPNGTAIKLFSLPYMVASKIEAFKSRGGENYYSSYDIEDIFLIVYGAGQRLAAGLLDCDRDLQMYISDWFRSLAGHPTFEDIVYSNFPADFNENQGSQIVETIEEIAKLGREDLAD